MMSKKIIIKQLKSKEMRYFIVIFLLVFGSMYANILSPSLSKKVISNNHKIQVNEVKFQGGFDKFKKKFALVESTNNPDTIHASGMLGLYGFGARARLECGYGHITKDNFKNNPKIWPREEQDKAFIRYLKINKKRISTIIKKYNNKIIGGVRITESGLLAACHLAGSGNVVKYFESNGEYIFSDANNTSVKDYLIKFGGYKFNLMKL